MLPFMGLVRECISSLVMSNSYSFSFLLGDIASISSPSLATSNSDSSTTTFGRSFLFPTIHLWNTPTSHADRTVLLPTLHLNLTIDRSLSRSTKALLQQLDHKKAGFQKIRIPSFPITSSASVPNRFLFQQHHVRTSSSPATFNISRCVTPTSSSLARLITLQR